MTRHRADRLAVRQVDAAPGLVYGPVQSRRFGRSLGVNLLPAARRLCNFDCVYCQCGGERVRARGAGDPPFPTLQALEAALAAALEQHPNVDDICFAGAGEPTLHPAFREAVLLARALRDRWAPAASLSVLSNGVAAGKPTVRGALALVDRPVLKLDAATDDLLAAVDGAPTGLTVRRLIDVYASLIGIETQTLLIAGPVDTATPDALDALGEALRAIRPRRACVGTATRAPGGGATVIPLSPGRLRAAVRHLRAAAPGVDVVAY